MCENRRKRGQKRRKMEAHNFSAIKKSHYEVTFLFFALCGVMNTPFNTRPVLMDNSGLSVMLKVTFLPWPRCEHAVIWRFVAKYGSAVTKREHQTSHLCARQLKSRSTQIVTRLKSITVESCGNRIHPWQVFLTRSGTPHTDGGGEDETLCQLWDSHRGCRKVINITSNSVKVLTAAVWSIQDVSSKRFLNPNHPHSHFTLHYSQKSLQGHD